ncbi:hypothetical protein HYPSUDRAFT_199336 [Hypholoma sublateritium FD-334 SS-4]|uniref:Uncharacterized protein n=1 Tax=Hypholoma sublateritium (strain FD-334 SS-4) TaxID=945553 RepID=A0A0D2P5D7_HYPSF|nr:hypothetical protein HYPSUDRAFT_199336 [Hypholoma sublateritium FD-334 SS-4]
MSDIWCMATLPQAFITAVGVDKEFTRNNLYIARCDLSIEPDLDVVSSLARRERLVSDFPNGVEGMLQMKLITLLDPSVAIDSGREKIWEDAKRDAFLRSGHFRLPTVNLGPILAVGLVDFHMEGTDQVITLPLPVQEKALYMARWGSDRFIYEDDTFPSGHGEIPLLAQQFCAMLNVHIQDDEKNQIRLRAHVPQESLKKYVGIDMETYMRVDRPMLPPQSRPNPNATMAAPTTEDKVMQRMHFR